MSCPQQANELGAGGDGAVAAGIELKTGGACPVPPICPEVRSIHGALDVSLPLVAEIQAPLQMQQQVQLPVQETAQIVQNFQEQVDEREQMKQQIRLDQFQNKHQTATSMNLDEVFARGIDPNEDDKQNPPCYLPQSGDELPHKGHLKPMGPIGPWATGSVDWSPMAGLTGTRPVVDRYSITRFSPNEWRAKNQETVRLVNGILEKADKNRFSAGTEFSRLSALVQKTQSETTDKVRQRAQLIGKWKNTLENSITAMAEELSTMESERIRLKKSLVILGVPESIAKECLEKRSGRADTELVRDKTEEELINELALIAEIRQLLKKTLEDFESQQVENRTARQRLEYDWSDKKEAYEIDTTNLSLNNNSKTILFRPGAIRQPPEQASEQYWEHFSKETLDECEKCRQKSIRLRATLNAILMNAARDIRTQADIVEKALTSRINCTQEAVQRYENDLKRVLQNLADTETRIGNLHRCIRSFDASMKVAQSRMYNRSYRPNVENCRDAAQQDLIDEVAIIQSSVSAMLFELNEAEKGKEDLMKARSHLEREIMLKRRSLWIDRECCMRLRSHYPSANALSGSAQF